MSINRDMKTYMLQRNESIRTLSGAEKNDWKYIGLIRVAVYKKSDLKILTSEKYTESTHTGLTYCKEIDSNGYRIVRDNVIYEVIDCNVEGRLTNLLLKVVR